MIPEIGSLCLYLSLIVSFLIMLGSYFEFLTFGFIRKLWVLNYIIIVLAFLCLIYSFAVSDFSVLNVANHSHLAKPMIYKISAAWGHHEGSMLLWLSALILFSTLFVWFAAGDVKIIALISAVQALILVLYTAYTIFTSSPFVRTFPAPLNGLGLNPILQDIGLALHPPMLYLGYVGFSLAFSSAIAILIRLSDFGVWAAMIRPWVMLSWAFLTLGIGLGSWWAYRELGWGGFWFWDPVENASLMPWLSGTALIHALSVSARRPLLQKWALFFAILTFSLSMVGTFLVRSGLITSVHAFATDPTRGIYVLSILSILVLIALGLFSFRARIYTSHNSKVGREKECGVLNIHTRQADEPNLEVGEVYPSSFERYTIFIFFNNILLFTAVAIVFIGTLYPFVLELFLDKQVAVGAPYYNKLFAPLVLVALIIAIKGSDSSRQYVLEKGVVRMRMGMALFVAVLISICLQFYFGFKIGISVSITLFSSWLLCFMVILLYKIRPQLSSAIMSMLIAHGGIAIVMFGISLNASYKAHSIAELPVGGELKIAGYALTLQSISYSKVDNYLRRVASIGLSKNGSFITELYPETRLYPAEQQQTTESAIMHKPLYDLYVVIGELQENSRIIVRAFYEPGISFIWFGCFVIFFGGISAAYTHTKLNSLKIKARLF